MTAPRRALVTGVSGGIGGAIAVSLLSHGIDVLGTFRNGDVTDLLDTSATLDGELTTTRLDVTDSEAITSLFDDLRSAQRLPDIVVCNAGGPTERLSLTLSDDEFDACLQLNLHGAFRVARALPCPPPPRTRR